jgi:hypothetical protein
MHAVFAVRATSYTLYCKVKRCQAWALYLITCDNAVLYNGFKLRALFVSPDAADRDIFYGMNFEFGFNTAHWDERRYTSEIRLIIGTHVGRFDFIFNPIVDNSYDGFANLEFVPATRVAMKVSDTYKRTPASERAPYAGY